MKWDTYKQLTPEQREEYNFRFKREMDMPIQAWHAMVLWALAITGMAFVAIIFTVPGAEVYAPQVKDLFFNVARITQMWIGIMLGQIIIWASVWAYSFYRAHKWIKQKLEENKVHRMDKPRPKEPSETTVPW